MKRYLFFTLFVLSFMLGIAAQDIILKTDGTEVRAKITDVSDSEVRYKKHGNLSGPAYVLPASEIFMITYENGEKDVFDRINSEISIRHINKPSDKPAPAARPAAPKYATANAVAKNEAAPSKATTPTAKRVQTANTGFSVTELGFELPSTAAGEKIYIGEAAFKNTAKAWVLFVLSADKKTIHHLKLYLEEVDIDNVRFGKIEVENSRVFPLTSTYNSFDIGSIQMKRLYISTSEATAQVGYIYEESHYSASTGRSSVTKHDLGESEVKFIVFNR
ncbi:MAG: hypothetical protein LBS46_01695 [Dysgonamonadaceae bacterium]|jgi:hypothetical protein|nr:hypothetical protein [Dysgonamonadaceae bacterium]